MQDFDCMYSALCVCLDDIARNTDMVWDGSTISEAQGLLHKISSAGFIAAFKFNHHICLVTLNHSVFFYKDLQWMSLQPTMIFTQ